VHRSLGTLVKLKRGSPLRTLCVPELRSKKYDRAFKVLLLEGLCLCCLIDVLEEPRPALLFTPIESHFCERVDNYGSIIIKLYSKNERSTRASACALNNKR
jgi:hypothetical protein